MVLAGMVVHPRSAARDVLGFVRDFMPGASDQLTVYASLSRIPDDTAVLSLAACFCADVVEGERVLELLRGFGAPLLDAFAEQPFPQLQKALDRGFPHGNFHYREASFLRHVDDEVVEVLAEHADRAPSQLGKIIIEYYRGAVGRVSTDATAFRHRDTLWDIGILAQWTDPAETPREMAWASEYAAAL